MAQNWQFSGLFRVTRPQTHQEAAVLNQRVKNELSLLATVAACLAYARGNKKMSGALALGAVALRFAPDRKPYSYRDKSVMITGGSRGLGLALADELVREGAAVTLLARDAAELRRAHIRLLRRPGAIVETIVCDVTNKYQIQEAIEQTRARFGTVDVLINNAGAISVGPFSAMDPQDFSSSMDIHFYAVLHATRAIMPLFTEKGGGKMINICSIAGKITHPHMSPYIASKFALSGFSRAITSEVAGQNVQVTTVYPGLMRTGSYIQAVFKGNHEKEYSWFATSDLLPGFSMSATRAAKRIVQAAREGNAELVLSIPAKLGAFFYQNLPGLTEWAMALYARALPTGDSHLRKTGAQSQEEFNASPWTAPLRATGHRVRAQFNQVEKSNPEFNLGI